MSNQKTINRGAIIQAIGNFFRLGEFGLTLLAVKLFGSVIWGQYIFITTLILPVIRISSIGIDKGLIWLVARHPKQKIPGALIRSVYIQATGLSLLILVLSSIYFAIFKKEFESGSQALFQLDSLIPVLLAMPFRAVCGVPRGRAVSEKGIFASDPRSGWNQRTSRRAFHALLSNADPLKYK